MNRNSVVCHFVSQRSPRLFWTCERLALVYLSSLTSCIVRASDDVQNAEKVRSLLKDLREARQSKSRDGLSQIDHSELSVRYFTSTGAMLLC